MSTEIHAYLRMTRNQQNSHNKLVLDKLKSDIETIEKIHNRIKSARGVLNIHNKDLAETLKILAKNGWYISEETSLFLTYRAVHEAQKNNILLMDAMMKAFYGKEIKNIIKRLCEEYPTRAAIFREAFKAHSRKMYFSSTILFLSQADGLCYGELFKINKNKKKLKILIENNFFPGAISMFSEVLTEITAIDDYYPHRKKDTDLNRHGVVHGYDMNFGTEINSLKALSILSFVGDFFTKKTKRNTNTYLTA